MENFSAWLGLVSASFATEVRFAMTASSPIDSSMLTDEQTWSSIVEHFAANFS